MSFKNVDRLSNMPDEVISHILSLMPTKFAVRTSVLSKSWIHTWKFVTNLVFEDNRCYHEISCFTKFVDRVLECCKASEVKLFRLHCSWVPGSRVCKWIDAAVRLNVCELDVKVMNLVLPHSFFTCKTLTKLSLHSIDNSDVGLAEYNYPSYVNLQCLKTIDIDVYCKASVTALNLIRGCPILESLSLRIFDPDNEDYDFSIPTLKHLKLIIEKLVFGISKVVLNVPKLEDLCFGTHMSTVFVMEDLSSLVSVKLSGYDGYYPLWVEVLKGVSGAKSLTLDLHCHTPSDARMPNFPYMKHLEFNASFSWNGLDWALFHKILENSPELEQLCIIMNPRDHNDYRWIEPQSVPTCMLKNLRAMKFANFRGQKSYLRFLAYLLRNAEFLTMLTITCGRIPLKEEMLLSTELLKLPRLSRYCEIHFLGSLYSSITS
uniref:FBD-associated F-box protein At5g56370-like n=1 Tax=Erigeron canadensis TaxID=72917 RepID=UPI001CB9652A|nr:FBD-associated F-box protein At5g56370-like [Erigeron canadensis]